MTLTRLGVDRRLVHEQRERLHGEVRPRHDHEGRVAEPRRRERSGPRDADRTVLRAEHRVHVRGVGARSGEALADLHRVISQEIRP